MRITRSFLYGLFPVFLCYYSAVADASLPGRTGAPHSAAVLPELGRLVSRLTLPAAVTESVGQAMDELRTTIMASGLMRDSRPSPEQERRDFVALWADLQPASPPPDLSGQAANPAGLIPGQD